MKERYKSFYYFFIVKKIVKKITGHTQTLKFSFVDKLWTQPLSSERRTQLSQNRLLANRVPLCILVSHTNRTYVLLHTQSWSGQEVEEPGLTCPRVLLLPVAEAASNNNKKRVSREGGVASKLMKGERGGQQNKRSVSSNNNREKATAQEIDSVGVFICVYLFFCTVG